MAAVRCHGSLFCLRAPSSPPFSKQLLLWGMIFSSFGTSWASSCSLVPVFPCSSQYPHHFASTTTSRIHPSPSSFLCFWLLTSPSHCSLSHTSLRWLSSLVPKTGRGPSSRSDRLGLLTQGGSPLQLTVEERTVRRQLGVHQCRSGAPGKAWSVLWNERSPPCNCSFNM